MGKDVAKANRGIPSKAEAFTEWYPFIVEAADLVDKRYPIKGMDVWRPYGWKTMRLIDDLTHAEMERTNHEEVNFPLLIPEDLLERENALVARLKRAREEGVDPDELRDEEEEAGFKKEVYWVRHAGENELDVPMFLRPTSETAMYTMFPLWIRSHADLPLKVYQMVNTFRYETKQTRSFIRVREIHFFEAHTAHVDEDDATRQIEQDLEIVDRLMHHLCLPVLKAKRPLWDTFPGAWYTIGIDAIMPNGRTLQVASCHHYRDQWAKAFDITYETREADHAHVHQTTYGMSERLLGAVVGMHGDDSGLIMRLPLIKSSSARWFARTPRWTPWPSRTTSPNAFARLDSGLRSTTVTCTRVRSTTTGRSKASPCALKSVPVTSNKAASSPPAARAASPQSPWTTSKTAYETRST
jgi:prolyl-tRNA synthetase